MFVSHWEADVHARHIRSRVAEGIASTRPVPTGSSAAKSGPRSVLARICRGLGHGLIAAGERLGGSATPRPAPAGRTA